MGLCNLNELGKRVKARYLEAYCDSDLEMTQEFKNAYIMSVQDKYDVVFHKYSATLTAKASGLKIFLPNQWFSMAAFMCEYMTQLISYKEKIGEIKILNDDKMTVKVFNALLLEQEGKQIEDITEPLKTWLINYFGTDQESLTHMQKFLTDSEWWSGGKSVGRGDYYVSPILQLLGLVNVTQTFIADIAYLYATTPKLYIEAQAITNKFKSLTKNSSSLVRHTLLKGENIIYYGAPGTGKSNTIEQNEYKYQYVERVTFYPEYGRDDFVGCYMPIMTYLKNDTNKYITLSGNDAPIPGKPLPAYGFIPGPFTKALIHAMEYRNENVLLIIEELNRANAAAVFGEIFQLLDRDDSGKGKYAISISNEYSEYLEKNVTSYKKGDKLSIPANLTIWATMNSADQGVNPLDAAFKRRWNFVYIPIDFSGANHKSCLINYGGECISWQAFGETINIQLKNRGINEDKHLGQYFITKSELQNTYKFASKILLYLYDDVLKFNRRGFFKPEYKTFSELLIGFNTNKKIFEFDFVYKKKNLESEDLSEEGMSITHIEQQLIDLSVEEVAVTQPIQQSEFENGGISSIQKV